MAEEHPPSPERRECLYAQEIAGQARNEGKGRELSFSVFSVKGYIPIRRFRMLGGWSAG